MNNNFQMSSSLGFSSTSSMGASAVITVRSSNRTYQSVGASSGSLSGSALRGASSYSVKGTTSFSAIHKDVSAVGMYTTTPASEGSGEGGRPGDIGDGYTGELIPSPVGDMLLPMLAMAVAYLIVKLFRKRKTSHIL